MNWNQGITIFGGQCSFGTSVKNLARLITLAT